jgi:hypothetical protein
VGVRKNIRDLTPGERDDLIAAIKALKANGTWDQYVTLHNGAMGHPTLRPGEAGTRNAAHRGPVFGPWHREMLRRLEADLAAQVPGVTLPYWDWTQDTADPVNSPLWDVQFMGGDGDPADGDHVKTGPFAFDPSDATSWTIVRDPMGGDEPPYLKRHFSTDPGTVLPAAADVAAVGAVATYDAKPWDETVVDSYRNQLEGFRGPDIHNRVHRWMGGSMLPGTSPNDPVFFLHHSNVDRLWAAWQRANPTLTDHYIPATDAPPDDGPPNHAREDPMWPWLGGTTPASVLDIHALGYWYDDEPPVVSALSPSSGASAGGDVVVITGMALAGATSVTFGGMPVTNLVIDSDTQITVTTPAGTAGDADVIITTANGSNPPETFVFVDGMGPGMTAPVVNGIGPSTGPEAGGTQVSVFGSGFMGATAVTFGATAAVATLDSDTEISALSPAGTGTVDVAVTTPGGTSATSPPARFTYAAGGGTTPSVAGVNPPSGAESGGDVVAITGTGFAGATAVKFGSVTAPNLFVDSDERLSVVTPAGNGTVDVVVVTASGSSAVTATDRFTFTAAGTVTPVVTGVTPQTGAESGGDTVVIAGSGFTGATLVSFGPNAAMATLDSDTQITALTPAGTGIVDVVVTTPVGPSPVTPGDRFAYIAPAPGVPVVSAVAPPSGAATGGDTVVITGAGFTGAMLVSFGPNPAVATLDSDTQITAVTPPGTGTVDVTVTNAAGTSATGGAAMFTYAGPSVPAVTAVTPASGTSAGGDTVVITGTGFIDATLVSFGPNAGVATIDSDTQITVLTPPGSGIVDVTVTTGAGTSPVRPEDGFTYLAAGPVVSGLIPDNGAADGGDMVIITGSGFTGATDVTVDGTPAAFTVGDDTQITMTTPPGSGTVDVVVTTPAGNSATGPGDQFTYN